VADAKDTYSHGHHESVLCSHKWRTAENSCAYLLPHLRPGIDLLDVGCGPGTITCDLAARVAPGRVVAIDAAPHVLEVARTAAYAAGVAVEFAVGDTYALEYPDESFDVVHAHQVLHHLTDPVRALMEMRRVLRPGGVLAVRESDYSAMAWAPPDPLMDRWRAVFQAITRHNGSEADAGRFLLGWAHAAGFADATAMSSTWTFAGEDRRWWGTTWAARVRSSDFATQALAHGICDVAELEEIARAWERWADHPDGVIFIVAGEVLARK
jgi:ubiquinone/menaquinone biosynthesis C-methylase UbiE